jgi:hypothetical protein
MPRYVRRIRTGLILTMLAAVVAVVVSIRLRDAAVAAAAMVEPLPADLAVALHRVGLGPEPATAAGLAVNDVSLVVENAEEWLGVNGPALRAADETRAAAQAEFDRLTRLVRSGTGEPEDVAALPVAHANLNTAETTLAELLDGLFQAATADVDELERITLTRLRSNADWTAALEFKVIDRAEPQWVAIRDALANERIAAKRGEPADQEAQAFLQQLRADPAVSAARASLEANLAAITLAWEAAVGL